MFDISMWIYADSVALKKEKYMHLLSLHTGIVDVLSR